MISTDIILAIHSSILQTYSGLKGSVDREKLEGAIARIDNWVAYENVDNIFDIAALYAVAIAKAHAFSDGNKRTAMVTMLAYLDLQGVEVLSDCGLDDVMVDVAAGILGFEKLSAILQRLVAN